MKKCKDTFGKLSASKNICGQFFGTTSLGERGQIVIPKKMRSQLKLDKGDNFLVMEKHGMIVLAPTGMLENMISNITKHLSKIK